MAEQQPPPPTLTLNPTPPDNPEKPPENTLPDPSGDSEQILNSHGGTNIQMSIKEANKSALSEVVSEARVLFRYNPSEPITLDENNFTNLYTTATFNLAVNAIISSLDKGYTLTAVRLPLSSKEWAKLSCKLLAAIEKGYRRTCYLEQELVTERAKVEAIDPIPIGPRYPTLFHRIAAMASDIETHISTDQEGYRDWYITLKRNFEQKAAKSATLEVEEK
jgi:hypothetical protein